MAYLTTVNCNTCEKRCKDYPVGQVPFWYVKGMLRSKDKTLMSMALDVLELEAVCFFCKETGMFLIGKTKR